MLYISSPVSVHISMTSLTFYTYILFQLLYLQKRGSVKIGEIYDMHIILERKILLIQLKLDPILELQ